MLLIDRTDARVFRETDLSVARMKLPENQLEQRRLADAVAADQPDLGPRPDRHRGLVEKTPAPGVEGQLVDLQHGPGEALKARLAQGDAAAISPRPLRSHPLRRRP